MQICKNLTLLSPLKSLIHLTCFPLKNKPSPPKKNPKSKHSRCVSSYLKFVIAYFGKRNEKFSWKFWQIARMNPPWVLKSFGELQNSIKILWYHLFIQFIWQYQSIGSDPPSFKFTKMLIECIFFKNLSDLLTGLCITQRRNRKSGHELHISRYQSSD